MIACHAMKIFYVCWLAFEGVYCYLFVVETKGLSLEETSALFDGEDATENIAKHAVEQSIHEPHAEEGDDSTDGRSEKGSRKMREDITEEKV